MNIRSLTDSSLHLLYECVRDAVTADREATLAGREPPCATLATQDWRDHASSLEDEMSTRMINYVPVTFPDGTNSRGL